MAVDDRRGRPGTGTAAAMLTAVAYLLTACGGSQPPAGVEDPGIVDDGAATEPPAPTLFGSPLPVAAPIVVPIPPGASSPPDVLQTNMGAWRGERSHLAGTAHYDRGEWIYEDYPWSAYGAAQSGTPPVYDTLDALGLVFGPAQRIPGGLAVVASQTGAGLLVDEADLAELRMVVEGAELRIMARTTTMFAPVRTALLLLFDTGRAGVARAVPFGSGLTTASADTAVLVTAAGARVVDLVSGAQSDAPATSDPAGYLNLLETRLPLARVQLRDDPTVRFVAAAGLVAPGSYEFTSDDAGGPLAKVVPRFAEPVQATYDRLQAVALANHDIDAFFTEVSLQRMRAGDSERLLPGVGYSVRTFDAPASRGSEGGTDGMLRQYGLYVPATLDGLAAPATIVFRGSSMTAHAMAAVTPGLFQNLGDDNRAIVISPCGRSGFDGFQGAVYLDVMQTLSDAHSIVSIDPERMTIAGYSMGGYATYMFAATRPDLFAGAFVIAGPVGGSQPATTLYGFPDVVPMLENLRLLPVAIYQGDVDADVPISNALAAVQRLATLGYRYRFNMLLANTHFSPGIQNDYSIGARYLRPLRRVAAPSRVHFARSMAYERAIDTASMSDQSTAGQSAGLHFDKAWFVHDLQAVDPAGGTATVDVQTLARPAGAVTPVISAGVDSGPLLGQAASPYQQQSWAVGAATDSARNALTADFAGVAAVTLDLADMALTTAQPLTALITTDATTRVAFSLEANRCVDVHQDGIAPVRSEESKRVEVSITPGEHVVMLVACQ